MAKTSEKQPNPLKAAKKSNYLESHSSQKLDPSDTVTFQSRMVAFCRINKMAARALLAGNIQLLGFEHVREGFGANWPKVKAKVHLLTESVIKKHVSSEDVYVLADDEQFIVLFCKADQALAARKSKKIADQVSELLLGFNDGTEGLSARGMTIELPRDKPTKLASVDALNKTVEEARDEKETEERRTFDESKGEMRVTFWPVTNIRKRLVSMYQANLVVPEGKMPDLDSESGALEAALDTFTLSAASAALLVAATNKKRAFLIVPVSLVTLDIKRFREAYIEQCRDLPQMASKPILLMVDGIPDDVPQSKLHGVFTYVAPFVSGFVGRFGLGFQRGDKFGGLSLLGLAANGSSVGEPSEKHCLEMSDFVVKNRVGKSRTFFTGTPNFDVATAARRAQFDYVQGAGVAPAMAEFGTVFKIS